MPIRVAYEPDPILFGRMAYDTGRGQRALLERQRQDEMDRYAQARQDRMDVFRLQRQDERARLDTQLQQRAKEQAWQEAQRETQQEYEMERLQAAHGMNQAGRFAELEHQDRAALRRWYAQGVAKGDLAYSPGQMKELQALQQRRQEVRRSDNYTPEEAYQILRQLDDAEARIIPNANNKKTPPLGQWLEDEGNYWSKDGTDYYRQPDGKIESRPNAAFKAEQEREKAEADAAATRREERQKEAERMRALAKAQAAARYTAAKDRMAYRQSVMAAVAKDTYQADLKDPKTGKTVKATVPRYKTQAERDAAVEKAMREYDASMRDAIPDFADEERRVDIQLQMNSMARPENIPPGDAGREAAERESYQQQPVPPPAAQENVDYAAMPVEELERRAAEGDEQALAALQALAQ